MHLPLMVGVSSPTYDLAIIIIDDEKTTEYRKTNFSSNGCIPFRFHLRAVRFQLKGDSMIMYHKSIIGESSLGLGTADAAPHQRSISIFFLDYSSRSL